MELHQHETALRLLMAMAAGGLLGLERTRKLRPAGLRTYTLISVGACLVMLAGLYLYGLYGPDVDPVRMAAQVVSGIGFIGAGTILTTRTQQIKGLTTAAGLWAAACLGLVIGAGMYLTAVIGFVMVVFVLWFADIIEERVSARLPHMQAHLLLSGLDILPAVIAHAGANGVTISDISLAQAPNQGVDLSCTLALPKKADHKAVIESFAALAGVYLAEQLPN